MRKTDFDFFLRLGSFIVGVLLLSFPLDHCDAQWDVRELVTLSGKISGSEMVVVGDLDGHPGNEIVWLIAEQTGGNRIMIVNGESGEIKWRSKTFFKIFPSSVKIGDIGGNNHNKLIFTGQLTSFDPISMYLVRYTQESYTDESAAQIPDTSHPVTQGENLSPNSTTAQSDAKPVTTPEVHPSAPEQKQDVAAKVESTPTLTVPKAPVHFLPDNISATIAYSVTEKSPVRVDIFDGTGDIVRTLVKEDTEPGKFSKVWDGTDDKGHKLPFGTYFYTVAVGKIVQVRKPILFQP
jgi:hypothetical protein